MPHPRIRYAYQRTGGPLVQWGPGPPPRQSQAADARSLGCAACIGDYEVLQQPGAPEPILGLGALNLSSDTLIAFGAGLGLGFLAARLIKR